MEIKDLRYFMSVSRSENIHRASKELAISPGSLSKAIARLEDELSLKLFDRVGRNIKLNSYGKYLQVQAKQILQLEEKARIEIIGEDISFRALIGAPEILLSEFGVSIAHMIKTHFPFSQVQLLKIDESELEKKIESGEIHLGISSKNVSQDFESKKLVDTNFKLVISSEHPLFSRSKKTINISEILKYEFVLPNSHFLGRTNNADSFDGWRDDKFPRKIGYKTDSLYTLESLVLKGKAIAYLPEFLINKSDFKILKIIGCSFKCNQKIRLITKKKKDFGWLNNIAF